jgi:hypothetical protein
LNNRILLVPLGHIPIKDAARREKRKYDAELNRLARIETRKIVAETKYCR